MNSTAISEIKKANEAALKEMAVLFPDLPENKYGDFLFEVTAFPFVPVCECIEQLRKLHKKSGPDYKKAISISMQEFERECAQINDPKTHQ